MKMMLASTLLATGVALALSSVASAESHKHIGASCGFADNPLSSHNRINHLFRNTSGASQWITCPAVRESNGSLSHAQIETNVNVSSPRFEMRHVGAGTLVGWNHETTTALGGTNVRYNWFVSFNGNAPAEATFAIEALLPNNAFVYQYRVDVL